MLVLSSHSRSIRRERFAYLICTPIAAPAPAAAASVASVAVLTEERESVSQSVSALLLAAGGPHSLLSGVQQATGRVATISTDTHWIGLDWMMMMGDRVAIAVGT
eukprot:GHVU01019182.1.p1 GENE.GHVU01019182.1~~GHVU01019182.1.p1  ORF type:complete len:105 (+),score=7.94 GHVU01019182.1:738-1052(+)